MSQYGTRLPPEQVDSAFQNATKHLLDRIVANTQESRTLATQRYTLLPRLVSGEMRVGEYENRVEAIV